MDLYQRLGIKRGASEAEIKKAYRSLAKQLHPDRNKDNPNAAKRFGEVTAAYDLLSDKDKRARYDRGEIDEEGNPKMPFGSGGFGGGARPNAGGFEGFPEGFQAGDTADLSDLFEGLFGGGGGRRGGSFGGFRQRSQPLQKGADIAYRLTVDFVDAAMLKPQRITLADGKTIDLEASRRASRMEPRFASQARDSRARAALATASSPSRSRGIHSIVVRATTYGWTFL